MTGIMSMVVREVSIDNNVDVRNANQILSKIRRCSPLKIKKL